MLTERGAGIVSAVVPDRNGVMGDVVLGCRRPVLPGRQMV